MQPMQLLNQIEFLEEELEATYIKNELARIIESEESSSEKARAFAQNDIIFIADEAKLDELAKKLVDQEIDKYVVDGDEKDEIVYKDFRKAQIKQIIKDQNPNHFICPQLYRDKPFFERHPTLKKGLLGLLGVSFFVGGVYSILKSDFDQDGLSNFEELIYQTGWFNPDSDGDGLTDGQEVMGLKIQGTSVSSSPINPDTDNDGLKDKEEIEFNSHPCYPDSDRDGLLDGEEIKYGSYPIDSDSDNDALDDWMEVKKLGSSPARMDIFVEVDWMENVQKLRPCELDNLKAAFANSPIENPDGSKGIDLHLKLDEPVPYKDNINIRISPGKLDDLHDYHKKYFDSEDGYKHAILTGKMFIGDKRFHGFAISTGEKWNGYFGLDATTKGRQEQVHRLGMSFMHELGHLLGLNRAVFDGIDTHKYSFKEYPSVMNDRFPEAFKYYDHYYNYSDGTHSTNDFNDWGWLQKGLGKSPY